MEGVKRSDLFVKMWEVKVEKRQKNKYSSKIQKPEKSS